MHEMISHSAPYIVHGTLALFGGFVHAAKAHRAGTTKSALDFLILTLMSSFTGVIAALIGLELFGHGSYLTIALAGAGGYAGVEGMSFLLDYLAKKFNIKFPNDN